MQGVAEAVDKHAGDAVGVAVTQPKRARVFQVGPAAVSDVLSLGDFMAAQSRTLVHHTGEGECTAEKR